MGKYKQIEEYYSVHYKSDCPDYYILGWESENAQQLRFQALSDCLDLNGKKILDVGCGVGDFHQYLKRRFKDFNYTGVDILNKMISAAKKKNTEGKFICADIFNNNPFEKNEFDAVFTSGMFNINFGNNKQFIIEAIKLYDFICKDIISFNLLHKDSPDREEMYFYSHPQEICELINKNFPEKFKFNIRQGYLKNDFTIICKKED